MNAASPDVSIIIPVHNRGDLLRETVQSCGPGACGLALQIIVIDDASTEDIAALAATWDVDYERLAVNSGSSVARNRGLEKARGAYVKFLDSDDVLVPGALRREWEAAVRTQADIVVAGWQDTRLLADGREEMLARYDPPRFSSIPDDLLSGRAVPTSAALYASRIAATVRWDPRLSKLNDWDYFVNAALRALRIETVDGPAYLWRQHEGARITSSTSFVGNAMEFYAILAKLEASLSARGLLSKARRDRLAQYLYKELRGLYRFGRPERHAVLAKIAALDPRFLPRDEERSPVFRSLARVLPLAWMLAGYGIARSALDRAKGTSP
jgi:glycosyltransferase involved in cell wall biosynthesis